MKIATDENEIPKRVYFTDCVCRMFRDDPSERCGAFQTPCCGTYTGSTFKWGKLLWVYETDREIVCPKCGSKANFIYVWDPKDVPLQERKIDALALLSDAMDYVERIIGNEDREDEEDGD